MSYENTGGRILLCPTADNISMVGDDGFAFLQEQADLYGGYLDTVNEEIMAMWMSNVRRMQIEFTSSAHPATNETEVVSQWKLDTDTTPLSRNLDPHPNPLNALSDGQLFYSNSFEMFFKDDGSAPYLGFFIPLNFFRHLGEWYMSLTPIYTISPDSVTITASSLVITYNFPGDVETYTHTILETFY